MIEKAVIQFRKIIIDGWWHIKELSENHADFRHNVFSDWAQGSWETIVETYLHINCQGIRLAVYGDGADLYPACSRISFQDDLPTHAIFCKVKNNRAVFDKITGVAIHADSQEMLFDRFVTIKDGWHYEMPPFDCVMLRNNEEMRVLSIDDVDWHLLSYSET